MLPLRHQWEPAREARLDLSVTVFSQTLSLCRSWISRCRPSVPTAFIFPSHKGGQQEEALIFSETSRSDLATRKRSRPPPSRIRSTALQRKRRKSPLTLSSAEAERMEEHPSIASLLSDSMDNTLDITTTSLLSRYSTHQHHQSLLTSVPLVVCPNQTGPVHRQDPIANLQSAVRGGGSVGDQRADVNSWSVEGSVLQQREASVRNRRKTQLRHHESS